MNGVTYNTVKSSTINESIYSLSDVDIHRLKSYLSQQSRSITDVTDGERNDHDDIPLDLYVNNVLVGISRPLIDNYRYQYRQHHYHHPHLQHTYEEPTHSLPTDFHNAFSLEIMTCGMQKNLPLPVPYENFSLITGSFGDDNGFTMQRAQFSFLGISDGAGGNLMYGYDPRLFSESLMRNCSELAHTGKYSVADSKRLLCHAFDRVQSENCFGSATACVVGIDCRAGRLYSVNIGDSGYVILRQGYVIYRSESQEMNGDCPRQLDVYPWTASLKGQGLNYTQISVQDAICQTFDLELNDVIILSTDGLFDNVPNYLIEQIVSRSNSLKQAANQLVIQAVRFYIKPDDILLIMARVITNNNPMHTQGESLFM